MALSGWLNWVDSHSELIMREGRERNMNDEQHRDGLPDGT